MIVKRSPRFHLQAAAFAKMQKFDNAQNDTAMVLKLNKAFAPIIPIGIFSFYKAILFATHPTF